MGLRFYRRVHIFPGLTVNVSRSGPSLSMGVRGAHVTFGRRGVTRTVGIPGTGIYYTSRTRYHTGRPFGAPGKAMIDAVVGMGDRGDRVALVSDAISAVCKP